ncbi:MAG: hypothetical protein IJP38_02645 [Oscillospiraceae bacterium]|nr:hypothetical protein [Oscillospiraceae bacterium]
MAFYLAIDLGTTGCRSILFDDSLEIVSSSYEEYGLITLREGWVEQDAELWWSLTVKTSKKAICDAKVSPSEVKGISISSQGITIVPVDKNFSAIYNAISWLDLRAEKETLQIDSDFGETEIFEHTGKSVNAAYTLPKLLWIKENLPEIWSSAEKFLMPMDFLLAKLTGKCVTDHSMASGTLLYDIEKRCWSKRLLDHYEIDENKLPEIRWSGECVGKVLPSVAQELGVSEDCVVAVGAQDQKCAALGAGLRNGTMTISLGTAAAVTKLWTEVNTKENKSVGWCGYTEQGTWVTEGVVSTAGTCLRWVRDMMFRGEEYSVIDDEAMQAKLRGSSLLFYPYLGEDACFYGASLATERGDFALAVMQGVAFEIRKLLEKMEADKGIDRLVMFGGGAKGDLWCQMISDITQKELVVPTTAEAAGAGAAMLAARAAGSELAPLAAAKKFTPQENCDEKYEKYISLERKIWER